MVERVLNVSLIPLHCRSNPAQADKSILNNNPVFMAKGVFCFFVFFEHNSGVK